MDASDLLNPTPEERELSRLLGELAGLEEAVAERELRLNQLEVELHVFEVQYLEVVGKRYAELDTLLAQIADLEAGQHPDSAELLERAEEAWARAQESADALDAGRTHPVPGHRPPSDSLKKLFRQVARLIHPDLAEDEIAREKREVLMGAANRAYKSGDEEQLASILREWEESPEAVVGHGTASELLRAIRQVARMRDRIGTLDREIAALKESHLAHLRARVEAAETSGRDLLAEMAAELEPQLLEASARLDTLVKADGSP